MKRRLLAFVTVVMLTNVAPAAEPVKYCRFQKGDRIAFGIVEDGQIRELKGDLFRRWSKTDRMHPLKSIKLLAPTRPRHVFAMAGNYKSHLNDGSATTIVTTTTRIVTEKSGKVTSESTTETEQRISGKVPEKFQTPQPFFKAASSIVGPGEAIVLPRDAGAVHYEAELVIVIGKRAKDVAKANAPDYVFGVTCGNDVSARVWQKGDVQWWRAKGSDTFGPCGPFIVSGLNYDDLLVQLRLNGETKQKERTSQLIHNVSSCVSFISRHVTLEPGDLIFTGTSGKTSELKPGDVVEVEIEHVGVLRNRVVGEK